MTPWARIALTAGMMLATAPAATAATYTVTDTSDTPVGQHCDADPGTCSLREAITSANGNPGDDVVLVRAGAYALTEGQLTVSETLAIQRDGAGSVIVDANGSGRVIEAVGGATALTLADLELREGHVDGSPAQGAGIRAEGPLTLAHVDVRANTATSPTAAAGGGIYHPGGAPVTISDSTITGNTAQGTTSALGGGIATMGVTTLTNVTVSDNAAFGAGTALGGGLHAGGHLVVSVSTFAFNGVTTTGLPAAGGAIAASGGSVHLHDSVLHDNAVTGENALGGGLWRGGSGGSGDTAEVTNTRLRDNVASGGFAVGGGAYLHGETATVAASTADGNRAVATNLSGGAAGGGIAVEAGTALELSDSTLHGNAVRADGSGNSAFGGGLFAGSSGSTVVGTTVTANEASGNGLATLVAGGGVGSTGGAQSVTVGGSIVSGNVQPQADADCTNATLASNGGNVVNQADGATGCAFTPGVADVVTADPQLGPLGDHAGLTPTAVPEPGSPALDRYDVAGACATPADQRGISRPQGPACDAGAVEARPATVTPWPSSLDFGTVDVGAASAAEVVSLSNAGDLPATGLTVALAGAHPGDFQITGDACGSTLAPASACDVEVRFAPTAHGARSAELTGPDTPVGLAGTGHGPPAPPGPGPEPLPACEDVDRVIAHGEHVTVTLRCSPMVWHWQVVDAPQHGRLSPIERDGTVRYTPDDGFSGHDAFTFRGNGPAGSSAPATVRITVGPGPSAPVSLSPARPAATCTVPDLAGRTVKGARRALAGAGCDARLEVTRRGDAPRRIVRQTPAAGTALPAGSAIRVTARPR